MSWLNKIKKPPFKRVVETGFDRNYNNRVVIGELVFHDFIWRTSRTVDSAVFSVMESSDPIIRGLKVGLTMGMFDSIMSQGLMYPESLPEFVGRKFIMSECRFYFLNRIPSHAGYIAIESVDGIAVSYKL